MFFKKKFLVKLLGALIIAASVLATAHGVPPQVVGILVEVLNDAIIAIEPTPVPVVAQTPIPTPFVTHIPYE